MTKFQTALTAASVLLMLGASTLPAPAQSLPATNAACSILNADARALTHYQAERPSTMPSILTYNPTGTAMVRIELTADGTPQNPTIVQSTGDYELDQAAKALVLSQRFTPEIRDCQSVPSSYVYEVDYNN
jgi:TonB family protein